MNYARLSRLCLLVATTLSVASESATVAAAESDPALAALHAVLGKNIGHAREWLEASDFKSLAQSGNGLQLLTEMLRARSDDPAWQAATRKVLAAVGEVDRKSVV